MHQHGSGTRRHGYVLMALAATPLVLNTASLPRGLSSTEEPPARISIAQVTAGALAAPTVPVPGTGSVVLPGQDGTASSVTVAAPKGERTVSESGVGVYDIPLTALQAYKRASAILADIDPGCRLPWTLLAAIGRVESNHGRYAGATLGTDGVSSPLIIGLPLNGIGPVAEIRDTDDGVFDQDTVWDRAVGPMQFLPGTWDVAGVDADGDDVQNPNDIDDAALAAAVYLCAGASNLTEPANMRAALLRYNNSGDYAALVMGYEQSYRTGDYTISDAPMPVAPGTAPAVPTPAVTDDVRSKAGKAVHHVSTHGGGHTEGISAEEVDPGASAWPGPPGEQPTSGPSPWSPSPTPKPSAGPQLPDGTPSAPPATHDPTPSDPPPVSDPTPSDPPPVNDPTPSDPPPVNDPTPSDPPPTGDATPSDPPPPADATPTEQTTVTTVGAWTSCAAGFCLDGAPLALGTAEQLGAQAVTDFDGDGSPETNADEFAGLADTTVTVVVDKQSAGWVVYSINGTQYRLADGSAATASADPDPQA